MSDDKIVPVADHLPPLWLDDMNPETLAEWSKWIEMVYDCLIHPGRYKDHTKMIDNKAAWSHPELQAIDPWNELCRDLNEKDDEGLDNPNWWGFRPELTHFYNGKDKKYADRKPDNTATTKWTGFPNCMNWGVFVGTHKVTKKEHLILTDVGPEWKDPESGHENNIYWQADKFRVYQDEYLEWAVTRDEQGRLTKVTFTCEGVEYWRLLAKHQPEKVVELYKSFVPESEKPKITQEALWTATDESGNKVYDPENQWNSPKPENGCIAHLIHPNSTLAAEIAIVADATIKRPKEFEKSARKLCDHGGFGEPFRSSDPRIGWEVYAACDLKKEAGTAVTVKEPVGLYIQGWDNDKFIAPDIEKAKDFEMSECWHPQRVSEGSDKRSVRVEFYVPPKYGFILEDMWVIGEDSMQRPLKYGSQIAEHIHISVGVECMNLDEDLKPAYDGHDWERSREVFKNEDMVEQYTSESPEFLHYMQYKAIVRAKGDITKKGPWYRWVEAYPELGFARKLGGGHTGGPLPPPKTSDKDVGISGVGMAGTDA